MQPEQLIIKEKMEIDSNPHHLKKMSNFLSDLQELNSKMYSFYEYLK